MSNAVYFTHHNVEINGETRQDKINAYIMYMGGTGRLLDYFLSNIQFTEENISEIEIIEDDDRTSGKETINS